MTISDSTRIWARIGQVLAGLGGLATVVLLGLTLSSPKAGIEASAQVTPFDFPESTKQSLDTITRDYAVRDIVQGILDSLASGLEYTERYGVADSISASLAVNRDVAIPHVATMIIAEIQNTGGRVATGVALQVPSAVLTEIVRPGYVIETRWVSEVIDVGSIRPGELVGLTIWSSAEIRTSHFDRFLLSHDSGTGDIDFEVLAPSWLASAADVVTSPFFWILLSLWVAMMLLLWFVQGNERANSSVAAPSDQDGSRGDEPSPANSA
jgi:hypothetical protein